MKYLSRSILGGLLCAALAFAFLLGCDKDEPVRKIDSGAVTEGDQTFEGKKTFLGNYDRIGTNATAVVIHSQANTYAATALLFGSPQLGGPRIRQLDEKLTLTSGVSAPMTTQLPAGAIILSVQGYVKTTITVGAGTTTTWSIGPTGGTVNTYGTAGYPVAADSLVAGSQSWKLNAAMPALSSAVTLSVFATATGGSSAGNGAFTAGAIRILVTYIDCSALQATEQ